MIAIVDLEANPDGCIGFAPREKREMLKVGMFARLHVHAGGRPERLWFKVMNALRLDPPGTVRYTGELVSDTNLDLEVGHELAFGPEHVCEWGTHEDSDSFLPGRLKKRKSRRHG